MSLGLSSNVHKVCILMICFRISNLPSLGFLDGGDRHGVLDSPSSILPPFDDSHLYLSSIRATSPTGSQGTALCATSYIFDVPTILVTNLSTLIFSEHSDLHPLLYPFGNVKKFIIRPSTPQETFESTMSVLVEYTTANSAKEAEVFLRGQSYAGHSIETFKVPQASHAHEINVNSSTPAVQDKVNAPLERDASRTTYSRSSVKGPLVNTLSRPFDSLPIPRPLSQFTRQPHANRSSSYHLSENRNQNHAAIGETTTKHRSYNPFHSKSTSTTSLFDGPRSLANGSQPGRGEADTRFVIDSCHFSLD